MIGIEQDLFIRLTASLNSVIDSSIKSGADKRFKDIIIPGTMPTL